MHLARFKKISLGHFPTAIEKLENLTRHLDGPEIYIKRDDCTGLASGGNKTRKLEFLVADALAQGADTLVTQGATQSNHVRQTAAAARKVGMRCHALLERRVGNMGDAYERTGNVLLDEMLGLNYHFRPDGADMNAEGLALTETLREQGLKPYFIPGGGSNPIGALGYASCAAEIVQQADDLGLRLDRIVHATGSAGTQAGLVAGLAALSAPIPVTGISVRAAREKQIDNVYKLAAATFELIGGRGDLRREEVVAYDEYVGRGYGQPTEAMVDAIEMMAMQEGIFLDPVYSGKGMAGMIDLIRKKTIRKKEKILFIHTGGATALFAYESLFSKKSLSS